MSGASALPPALQTLLGQAVALMNAGKLAEAETILASASRQYPDHPDVLQFLGVCTRRAGRAAEAIGFFEQSLKHNPRQPAVLSNLGGALLSAGRPAEAIERFQAALTLDPNFAQAAYNLGLALIQTGRFPEAVEPLTRAAALSPQAAQVHEALGITLTRSGQAGKALDALEKASALAPNAPGPQHNRAVALEALGRNDDAIQAFRSAARLAPGSGEIAFAHGNALRNAGRLAESIPELERAVALLPGHLPAHAVLNETLWQAGQAQGYLHSYARALDRTPQDANLRQAFAAGLLRTRQYAAAEQQFRMLTVQEPARASAWDGLAQALAKQKNYEDSDRAFARALEIAPGDVAVLGRRAEFQTLAGEPGHAADILRKALNLDPFDQENLARLSVALRIAGDEARHRQFSSADDLGFAALLEPPPGFGTIAEFNAALAERLRTLHTAKQHPTDQTLHGGTQTLGALFAQDDPLIRMLKVQIEKAVMATADRLPSGTDHPFYARKPARVRFSGSWSVRLAAQGFHHNHIHPQGWMSSAYYVVLPPETAQTGPNARHEGWFKMGETNTDTSPYIPPERWVQPQEGMLVLFPSYMWHGTEPFRSGAERLTVAFDVMPDT